MTPTTVRWLRMQGFTDDEACLAEASFGLRIAPALCVLAAGTGTVLASPSILFALAAIALLGAVLPFHPFDLIYNFGLRFWLGRRALPPNGLPRRLSCAIATLWLSATALSFLNGELVIGYVLGVLFVGVAGLLAATHFCIPSFVFHLLRQVLGPPSPAT